MAELKTKSGKYFIFHQEQHPSEDARKAYKEVEDEDRGGGLDSGPWHFEPTGYDGGYGYRHKLAYAAYSGGFTTPEAALAAAEAWEKMEGERVAVDPFAGGL